MTAEENKAVVVRVNESISRGNLGALDEHPGMAGTKKFLTSLRQAFPDVQATIQEIVAEGDWVAVRLISRGTQQGTWHGVAPTGQQSVTEVLSLHRFVDGRIVATYSQGGPMDSTV
jgi:predicted ester cyclase